MKLTFLDDFDETHKKGFVVEVDDIKLDRTAMGNYVVRVINECAEPVWLPLAWFIRPNTDEG
jgi:hypothetical protein